MLSLLTISVPTSLSEVTYLHVITVLLLLYVVTTVLHHRVRSNAPPLVWSWLPFLRSALSFGRDPSSFLRAASLAYGPVFTVDLAGKNMTFITHVHAYNCIHKHKASLAFFPIGVDVGVNVIGQRPVFASSQHIDREVHILYVRHLSGAGLEDMTTRFSQAMTKWVNKHAVQYREKYESNEASSQWHTLSLLDFITHSIFSCGTRALWGDLLTDDVASTNTTPGQQFKDYFYKPSTLLDWFQKFDHIFPLLMVESLPRSLMKVGLQARSNLLSLLSYPRSNQCEFFDARVKLVLGDGTESEEEKRNLFLPEDFGSVQLGILWALHGNTIPAAFWTLFYLMKDVDAFQRVKQEVVTVCEKENIDIAGGEVMTREALRQMELLDSAISEALRMATGSIVMRKVVAPCSMEIAGKNYNFQEGDTIALYPYLTHHDENIYENPNVFKVDRFVGKNIEAGTMTTSSGERIPLSFMPFGTGTTLCPGRHFARNEIKLFLSLFLTSFDIRLPSAFSKDPPLNLTRAGLGIFPPAHDITVEYKMKANH